MIGSLTREQRRDVRTILRAISCMPFEKNRPTWDEWGNAVDRLFGTGAPALHPTGRKT